MVLIARFFVVLSVLVRKILHILFMPRVLLCCIELIFFSISLHRTTLKIYKRKLYSFKSMKLDMNHLIKDIIMKNFIWDISKKCTHITLLNLLVNQLFNKINLNHRNFFYLKKKIQQQFRHITLVLKNVQLK